MNPFFLLLLLVVIAVLGWRGVRRERERVAKALKEAEASLQKQKTGGRESLTLEQDPKTGVYRRPGDRS
jgi:hypothetical protein